jgi:hypothetical protein
MQMTRVREVSFYRLFFPVLLAIAVVSLGIALALPADLVRIIVRENGVLENVQVIFYVLCAIISLVYFRRKIWSNGAPGAVILVFFALRELDFQKKFTNLSITRTKFYFSPDISLLAKIIGGAIVLLLIITLVIFVRRNAGVFFTALRSKERFAQCTLTAVILLPIAAMTDASIRYLNDMGIDIGEQFHLIKAVTEEVLELAIPLLFLIALFQYGSTVFGNSGRA